MKARRLQMVSVGVMVLASLSMLSVANAQTRIGIIGEILEGDFPIPVPGFGTPTVDIDTTLIGVDIAMPIGDGEAWEVSTALIYGKPEYEVLGVSLDGILETDVLLQDLNISYYFGDWPVQPVATAGIGWGLVKNEIPLTGLSETNFDFTYNLGVGAEWDISDQASLRGMYKIRTILDDSLGEDLDLEGFSIGFYWVCN